MRIGRQTPTRSLILPYKETKGVEAVEIYNRSKTRAAMEWQELLLSDIMAVNEDGLWTHLRFGYSLPRRNGKNEVLAIFGVAISDKIKVDDNTKTIITFINK